jgi:predicted membrane-bound spermidine synthase
MRTLLRSLARRIGLYEVIAFITGFVLMAFELAASRILAPTVGTSTYVWTSVIGVMIAALAFGYAAGGWAADRRSQKADIAWLLLAAAMAILITCMFAQSVLDSVSHVFHDPRVQGVLASTILFVPASFLLGMASPYLAKLRVQSIKTTGRSVAGLSASNSLGGITGTFCTGFIFFTIIGSRETLALLAGVLIACSWAVAPRLLRKPRVILSVVLLGTLLLQFAIPAEAGVVADVDTPTSHYKIVDGELNKQPVRVLIMGPGGLQSGAYRNGSKELVFGYTQKIAEVAAAAPQKKHILILGGGAFSLPEYMGTHYPASQVDVVEIDPQLPAIAKKYFDYKQPGNVRVFTEDARTYLQTTTERYDLVIVDAYNDSSIPFALTTREYAAALKAAMTPNGVVTANLIGAANDQCMPLLASVHQSYDSAFSRSLLYPLDDITLQKEQNIIAVYSNASLTWANNIDGSTFVGLSHGTKLTDNHAPIEYLHQKCGGL